MNSVISEADPDGFLLKKLIVVASGCTSSVISEAREIEARDSRIDLQVEGARQGKAQAINRIIGLAQGEFLVFVNSDAAPEKRAIQKLLAAGAADDTVGAVSAMPITEDRHGLEPLVVDLMWTAHNECSTRLNHMNLSNHSSDELVLFRSSAIEPLPKDLVNDGAFLAASVRRRGYTVKVCTSAGVHIQTPRRISDLVAQRRRIIFGHRQVWQKTGSPPKTIESMLFISPSIGMRILVQTLARRPSLLFALPVAVVSELASGVLSAIDAAFSTSKHVVWRRFA
jgi:cellulose synthase/poly-beta-1,6-N-acetylglucosamine synthase-like glycosyltransferase